MTVCVAAICEGGQIIGASDRMLTADDIEFEPPQAKILWLTTAIAVLNAGEAFFYAEIIQKIQKIVGVRVSAEPTNWWSVREVVELYRRSYREASLLRAEDSILGPLGLDRFSFIAQQANMHESVVNQLTYAMQSFYPSRDRGYFHRSRSRPSPSFRLR